MSRKIKIIPAIDILDGKVVRLIKGDYGKSKIYSANPAKIAQNFAKAGIKYLHIVDLDGAKAGKVVNKKIIQQVIAETGLKIQLGGGIRNLKTAQKLFDIGVSKIIIGSALIKNPDFFKNLIDKYGSNKIIAGIDVKNDLAAISGWKEATDLTTKQAIELAAAMGAEKFVITDISRDGALAGPNFKLYEKIKKDFPSIKLIASGGVSSEEDINNLDKLSIEGVIVGKAIYEGKIKISN